MSDDYARSARIGLILLRVRHCLLFAIIYFMPLQR